MNKDKMLVEQLQYKRQQAIAEQKEKLLERAKRLGFEQVYEGIPGWIILSKTDCPYFRCQFQESDNGLERLAQFLVEHGNYGAKATNKAGNTIHLSVDHEEKFYRVAYPDLALLGYDVVFHIGTEAEAQALYAALLTVEEVGAD
jgi:hypothetical protein